MNTPLISVVMPVYNCQNYVDEAINSVLSQTYKHFELIIIDDGSKDKTLAKVEKYAKNDKRIRVFVNKENMGIGATLNIGLEHAKGVYIARMDGDDTCAPSRFEKELMYLEKHPEKDLVFTDLTYIDEKGKQFGKRKYTLQGLHKRIQKESPIAHATVLFKKSILNKTGMYNSAFDGAEDYDLWIRMHLAGIRFGHLAELLYDYRMQPGSTKYRGITKQLKKVIKVKRHAINNYQWKMGCGGKIRLFMEVVLSHLPDRFVMLIYKLVYIKK